MKSNFKILIVDDEVLIAEFLKDELFALGYTNVELAHNSKQAFASIEKFNPLVVLLDIRMKSEREGIEIAEKINETYNIPFIFITAHSDKEIVQQALGTKPAGYITKPFKQIDVYAAIHLIEMNTENTLDKYFILKDGYTDVKILFDDILFAESNGNYIQLHTISKKFTIRNSLDWFKEQMPEGLFHRTHRSFIVNITKITKSTSKSVFINDIEIPVSRGNQLKLN